MLGLNPHMTSIRCLLSFAPGAELGDARGDHCLPKIYRSLSESPTQTIDSSPYCKTGPPSSPPNENVWIRPCFAHSPLNITKNNYRVCMCGEMETELHLFFQCNVHCAARTALHNKAQSYFERNQLC